MPEKSLHYLREQGMINVLMICERLKAGKASTAVAPAGSQAKRDHRGSLAFRD